ncbi:hypothetical protein CLOM_g3002 [Closterium sp. NIES-68]|nr:hypothetical protein CLOM_g3002 [Closterium sp. NIES-68]GJP76993.1 hypothetical protein CLOP_g7431 [Closterium sp. NIES-67]
MSPRDGWFGARMLNGHEKGNRVAWRVSAVCTSAGTTTGLLQEDSPPPPLIAGSEGSNSQGVGIGVCTAVCTAASARVGVTGSLVRGW